MSRNIYRPPSPRGLLLRNRLQHCAEWLLPKLGCRLESDAFATVQSVAGGGVKVTGRKGFPGPPGDPGPMGPPGGSSSPRGERGPPGPDGLPGPAGTEKGPKGPKGPAGGDQVMMGALGPPGLPGPDQTSPGDIGIPGDAGGKGEPGDPGEPGADIEGPPGPDGSPVPGPRGPDGSDGPDGEPGEIGSTGDPGFDGDPGDPGDKFAIVEAGGQCVGLYAIEAPDVVFEAVLRFTLPPLRRKNFKALDPLFYGAVEPGSLRIVGVVTSMPAEVVSRLDGYAVVLTLPMQLRSITMCVTVQGVRRGFQGHRWADGFTEGKRLANDRFYRQAWSGGGEEP